MVKKSSNMNNYKATTVTKPVVSPITKPMTESQPSFMSKIADGIAVGIGASLGDRLISTVFGPRTIQIEKKTPIDCNGINPENINCDLEEYKSFPQCIKKD